MAFPILGLHHVTATVDEAQPDLDFCLDALGLRLVKKTVNFDNHHVYHFYYGDERGTPGTIWTTFPYHGRGVRTGVKGAGQVTVTSFSVPADSLSFWTRHLMHHDIACAPAEPRFGDESIVVTDPSGLLIEMVATDRDRRTGWNGARIDPDYAIRGLHSVSLTVLDPDPTVAFMTELLGYSVIGEAATCIRLGVDGGGPGKQIDLIINRDAPAAMNGIGTVHHVAMAIGSAEEQLQVREGLIARGLQVTPVRDRQYFQSIYFREPGGVLIEIATRHPGFSVDEPLEQLGRALKLPPWEEPHRAEIERGLVTVRH